MSEPGAVGRETHAPLVPMLADHGALAMTEADLRDWGRRFGRASHAPLLVTLAGELGTGKTTLVQSICAGYGVTPGSSRTVSVLPSGSMKVTL